MKKLIALMTLVLIGTCTAAQASDSGVLVSTVQVDGGYELIFELANDAGATALQFDLALPAGIDKESLSGCVAGVLKTHAGGCNMVGDSLRVLVYSMRNEPIPTGELGRVFVPAAGNQTPTASVAGLVMSAPGSQRVQGDIFLEHMDIGVGDSDSNRKPSTRRQAR